MTSHSLRVGLLASHPIQYYAPWYRALAQELDLEVFFSHRQTAQAQGAAGFGVAFDWDVPLLEGYRSHFLRNRARTPNVERFWGCNTPELSRIIRDRAFDAFIVHGWSTWSYWQAILSCWRTGTPILVRGDSHLQTPRRAWWRLMKRPLFRTFVPRFDGYLIVGSRARRYVQYYGADPDRCFDAPHCVDNGFFATAADALRPERTDLRRQFGLPADSVVFLFAGKLMIDKEADTFVRAIAAAARAEPRVCGLIAGDGPLRQDVETLARTLSAPVRFAGFLNQGAMPRAYAVSDVLVVPSRHETWGLVVNEAMACGLPAIVSEDVGCAEDLVRPGITGEVFPTGDAGALAASIGRLTGHFSQLGSHARQHIAAFDIRTAAAGTVQAVRAVSARKRGRRDRRPARVTANRTAR